MCTNSPFDTNDVNGDLSTVVPLALVLVDSFLRVNVLICGH